MFQNLRRDLQLEPVSSREVVRRDQNLTAEAESLDKAVVEFIAVNLAHDGRLALVYAIGREILIYRFR
jgi:hypothetical protein